MLTNNIKRRKRGSISFVLILLIIAPIVILSMANLIAGTLKIQNSLTGIASDSNINNSIYEITLFESLNYIDGIALSNFNNTELVNKVSSTLTTNLEKSEVMILVDEKIEIGNIQLKIVITDKETLVLKIDNIKLIPIYEEVEIKEGVFEKVIVDYEVAITDYIESRWIEHV